MQTCMFRALAPVSPPIAGYRENEFQLPQMQGELPVRCIGPRRARSGTRSLTMFGFGKRASSHLYLSSLTVVPRNDLEAFWEANSRRRELKLDDWLRRFLQEIFDLSPASAIQSPTVKDLGLDVALVAFAHNRLKTVVLFEAGLPLLLRPKVELRARLTRLDDGSTLNLCHGGEAAPGCSGAKHRLSAHLARTKGESR